MKEKLVQEAIDLDWKIHRLKLTQKPEVVNIEQALISDQLFAMETYKYVLGMRIALIK